jgi:hypothetical protein
VALDPASLPDDVDALKRMIVGMARDAVQANMLIEKLRSELARLKRVQFGVSSEKLRAQVEQLELAIEAVESFQPLTALNACGYGLPDCFIGFRIVQHHHYGQLMIAIMYEAIQGVPKNHAVRVGLSETSSAALDLQREPPSRRFQRVSLDWGTS